MREMGDADPGAGNAGAQFDNRKNNHPPFGFQRDGREQQHQHRVRIQQRKADQDAVDGARSTQHRCPDEIVIIIHFSLRQPMMHLKVLNPHMQGRRAESANEIEKQEPFRAQGAFQHGTEHEQGIHVEENVPYAAMHEHVRKGLPPTEKWRRGIEHGKGPYHEILVHQGSQEHDHIYDNQVLGNLWNLVPK